MFICTRRDRALILALALANAATPALAQSPYLQQGLKLVGNDASTTANQGESVALSADGNTAIVGGTRDSNERGAAWVYTRVNGVWSQQGAKLNASDALGANPHQGISVGLSGDGKTAIVGGYHDASVNGAAWIYTRDNIGVWTQRQKLTSAINAEQFGRSVALSTDGNTAIIGAWNATSPGRAYVFTRDTAGVWTQQTQLIGGDANGSASMGVAVALSANGNTAIEIGRAHV